MLEIVRVFLSYSKNTLHSLALTVVYSLDGWGMPQLEVGAHHLFPSCENFIKFSQQRLNFFNHGLVFKICWCVLQCKSNVNIILQ